MNKRFPVLITTEILKEGVNIPEIEALVIASAGKDHRQTAGRALRGGGEVEIHDFYDSFNKRFEKQSKKRIESYKKEGFQIINV